MIRFTKSKKKQVREPVRNKDVIVYLADMSVIANDNCFPFNNNVEYVQTKFMQSSKMTKVLVRMFFNNLALAPIWKHLSYKNVNEMRALLIELPYSKVTW